MLMSVQRERIEAILVILLLPDSAYSIKQWVKGANLWQHSNIKHFYVTRALKAAIPNNYGQLMMTETKINDDM